MLLPGGFIRKPTEDFSRLVRCKSGKECVDFLAYFLKLFCNRLICTLVFLLNLFDLSAANKFIADVFFFCIATLQFTFFVVFQIDWQGMTYRG